MKKNNNHNNEIVTRGVLREILIEGFNKFGAQFAAQFGGELLEKIGIMMDAKLDKSIGDLTILVQKRFVAVTGDIHALNESVDSYQREGENTRADVRDIKIRVNKLEKKVKL